MTQVIDNFTVLRGSAQLQVRLRLAARLRRAHRGAAVHLHVPDDAGLPRRQERATNRFGYTTMTQLTGELGFNMSTNIFSVFVQDDWQVASSLKLLYGLRYDLYKYPEGLPNAPLAQTHELQHRSQQHRAARRRGLADRRRHRAAREHRHHVRPGDPRRLRAGAAAVGFAARAGLHLQPDDGGRAGVPGQPRAPARSRSSRRGRSIRTSRSRTPGSRTRRSSAPSAAT